jgi:DNA sulfur modification protein DndE
MFNSIKTSKANKELVTQLTNKLNLGAENIIARLAFSYSLTRNRKLNLSEIEDSGGKEYNAKVLFSNYADVYTALIATHYNLHKADKDIAKYVKMHIDDGLKLIEIEITEKDSITGNDFLINEIEKGLRSIFK